jgi:hypothetical protein
MLYPNCFIFGIVEELDISSSSLGNEEASGTSVQAGSKLESHFQMARRKVKSVAQRVLPA